MQFNNPIVSGEELAITAIRSRDYVEATDGWRISRDGNVQISNLNALGDLGATGQVSGDSVLVGPSGLYLSDGSEVGARLTALETSAPQGVVGYAKKTTPGTWFPSSTGTNSIGIMSLDVDVQAGRIYEITSKLCVYLGATAAVQAHFSLLYTTDGSLPSLSSPVLVLDETHLSDFGHGADPQTLRWTGTFASDCTLRLMSRMAGFTTQVVRSWISTISPHDILVRDLGAGTLTNQGYDNAGGGTATPPPPVPKTYTKTYQPTWSRTYDGDNTTTWDDSAHCYQGYYSSDRGNTRSLVGYPYATIMSDLSGATVNSVKITFKVLHAYYNAGMEVHIGGHNYTSKPSTWADANVSQNWNQKGSAVAGSTYTVTLVSTFGANLKSGAWKGIAFGPGSSNSLTYYGYLAGYSETGKPYLTITYTK
jgi:hypothetical protein